MIVVHLESSYQVSSAEFFDSLLESFKCGESGNGLKQSLIILSRLWWLSYVS